MHRRAGERQAALGGARQRMSSRMWARLPGMSTGARWPWRLRMAPKATGVTITSRPVVCSMASTACSASQA